MRPSLFGPECRWCGLVACHACPYLDLCYRLDDTSLHPMGGPFRRILRLACAGIFHGKAWDWKPKRRRNGAYGPYGGAGGFDHFSDIYCGFSPDRGTEQACD